MNNEREARLIYLLTAALLANELENTRRAAYKLSDPDGLHSGKSGYSFGICQFDFFNNPRALRILQECQFTPGELERVRLQDKAVSDLDAKLRQHAAVVDKWDQVEIGHTVRWVDQVSCQAGLVYASDAAFIHACDYHNQYNMEAGGKCIRHLQNLKRPITAQDIRDYKYTTAWGKTRPDDVDRRFENIAKIIK